MSPRPARRPLAGAALAALATLLAACSSTPPQFYTLAGTTAPPTTVVPSPIAVELLPVTVPEQVDQPQLMLRTGTVELTADYNARWAAALGEEVRSALAASLYRQAGIADLAALAAGHDGPLWRVQVKVQAFDLPASGPVALDAQWRARRVDGNSAQAWICRAQLRVTPETAGNPGLVAAQRQAIDALAAQIADALNTGTGTAPAGCRQERPADSATVAAPARP